MNTKQLSGSSLCYSVPEGDKRLREIELRTLDNVLGDRIDLQGPILLKVDVQGHELDVIKGGKDFVQRCDVIILEIPLFGPWGGGSEFADYIAYMREIGFSAYDIINYLVRPYDKAAGQWDIVFVKTEGMFRKYKLFN